MSTWKQAQAEELVFWACQNYDIPACYARKYKFFSEFIESLPKEVDVLDVGCGAIAYSVCLGKPHWRLTLVDSLIKEYLALPPGKTNLKSLQLGDSLIWDPTFLASDGLTYDLVLFLNVLDHVEDMTEMFKNVSSHVRNHMLFYCDLRTKTNGCHPHIVTKELLEGLFKQNGLGIVKNQIAQSSDPEFQGYWAILKKGS